MAQQVCVVLSAADREQLATIAAGATYVFDLGYYDYAWWAKLDLAGCRIVTRLKRNTPVTVTTQQAVPEGSNIRSDRLGHLPARPANSRNNPLSERAP